MHCKFVRKVTRARSLNMQYFFFVLAIFMLTMPFTANAQIVQKWIVGKQSSIIKKALSQGKGVLLAHKTVFNPLMDVGELPSVRGGDYRPPLTYWLHRDTKATLVLGGYDSEEGRGKLLTNNYHFFILEPGMYDLAGYVKKTRYMENPENLPRADSPIRSSIGFVNFSKTVLPALQSYTGWVPPRSAGTTFDGHTITNWYDPGYYEERVRMVGDDNAVFVDMRGLVPYSPNGDANIASFLIEAGQIAVVGDFQLDFTHGKCDRPASGQWVCPVDRMTLAMPFSPQQDDVQNAMKAVGYKSELIGKVSTALLIPGQFFSNQKMKHAPDLRTTRGQPYAMFTARSSATRKNQ